MPIYLLPKYKIAPQFLDWSLYEITYNKRGLMIWYQKQIT